MEPRVVREIVHRIGDAKVLDRIGTPLGAAVDAAVKPGAIKDLLAGTWLGHPLHPVLTDLPIGAWSSSFMLDVVGGKDARGGADTLLAIGIAASVPTVAAGLTDWTDTGGPSRRIGVAHALGNVGALALFSGSLAARRRGNRAAGFALSALGIAVSSASAYLGGHLSFRQAAGANHTSDLADLFPSGWQGIGTLAELPEGELTKRTVGGIDLLVVRRGQHVDVLADKCTHLSGPLSEGTFRVEGGQGCVVCPWHGSTFRLSDGGVVHGPTTSPQPRFDVRVTGGAVEVRLPGT